MNTPVTPQPVTPQPAPPSPPVASPRDDWAEERRLLAVAGRVIGRLFLRDAKNRDRSTRWTKAILILGGAFLAGIAQYFPDTATLEGGTIIIRWAVVGWVGVTLVLIGGVWTLVAEQTAPAALEEARRGIEKAKELSLRFTQEMAHAEETAQEQDEYAESLENEIDWFAELYSLTVTFRELIERQLDETPNVSDKDVLKMFNAVSRSIRKLVEFEAGELWTIAVFRLQGPNEADAGRLVCVADARADKDKETRKHRTWGAGEGVAGQVLVTHREVVVHDQSDKSVYHWLHVPNEKPEDVKRYRSLIGIPVLVGKGNKFWGVVVATSDRANRFRIDHLGQGDWEMQPLRLLADMLALLVAPSQLPTPLSMVGKGGGKPSKPGKGGQQSTGGT